MAVQPGVVHEFFLRSPQPIQPTPDVAAGRARLGIDARADPDLAETEEHTSELQSH